MGENEQVKEKESRAEYWNKWNKLATDEENKLEKDEESEKREADILLGLDKARSLEEDLDKKKDAELRAEKKAWDEKKIQEENLKQVVANDSGVDRTFVKTDVNEHPVLIFKGCKDSRYVFPAEIGGVIKIFAESCENTTFVVDCVVITQHLELTRCNNCEFHIMKPVATIQVDVSENSKIVYGTGAAFKEGDKVYCAGSTNINIVVQEPAPHSAIVSYLELLSVLDDDGTPPLERQFVTQLVDGKLITESVHRLGYSPCTRRELDVHNDESMDAQRQAELNKEKGNEAFGNREYAQAGVFYTMAIETAPKLEDGSVNPLRNVCLSNRAACFLKLGQFEKALADAEECTQLNPLNTKGWFRMGLALHALERYKEAMPILGKARDLEPKNKPILQALQFAEVKFCKQQEKLNKANAM